MKSTLLLAGLLFSSALFASDSDSTGLEGDNLDLNAVMEIFKESESPEDFEKKLNTENSNVNNLDLNEDGEVDYIRVVDTGDSISHALTLQVPVNENESQDVAVIEMEETASDSVELQIVGDEELYGENYILVPQSSASSVTVVNVYGWRPVRHLWGPRYVFWVSPWRYRHHPKWWRPWKRRTWSVYHGRVIRHRGHCRRIHRRRITHVHVHHYHRTHSVTFHKKHHHKHVHVHKTARSNGPKTGTTGKQAGAKPNNASGNKQPATSPASKPKTSQSKAQPAKQQASPQKSKAKQSQQKKGAAQQKQNSNTRKRPGSSNARKSSGSKNAKKSSNTRKRPGSSSSGKRKH